MAFILCYQQLFVHFIYSLTDFFFVPFPDQIGNPLLRLDRDSAATYEFFWSHGMISDELGLTITKECDFDDYVYASPHNVSFSCNQALSEANSIVGEYINNYDVILDVCYPAIVEQELRLRRMVFSQFPP